MRVPIVLLFLAAQSVQTPTDLLTAAQAQRKAGARAAARELFEQAATACERANDMACAGRTYNELGLMAWEDAAWSDVSRWYARAAEAFERAGDLREQARALRATTFDGTMATEKTLEILDRAEALAKRASDAFLQGLILHHRGDMEFAAGRFVDSQIHLEAALELLERGDRPDAVARVLTSLGRSSRIHGQPDAALQQYRRALEIQRKAADLPGQSQTLNAISIAYDQLGLRERALAHSREALAIARKSGVQNTIIPRLAGLANAYIAGGRYRDAMPLVLEAIRLHGEVSGSSGDYELTLAKAHLGLRQYEEALAAADRALKFAQTRQQPEFMQLAYWYRARALEGLSRIEDALSDVERSVGALEGMRSSLVPVDALKQGFAEQNSGTYATLVRLLLRTGQAPEALLAAERGRARAFLDLLVTRSVATEVDSKDALLARLRNPTASSLRSFMSADPPRLEDVVATARRLHSHVLSYWIDDHGLVIWVLSPDGVVRVRRVAVTSGRLERLVRTTWQQKPQGQRGAATRGQSLGVIEMDEASREAFRTLYDLLILPVRQWLPRRGDERLTVVPYGPLFRLSFAALMNERSQYLIEGYSVHYSPSLAVLGRTAARPTATAQPSYLMVADPEVPPRLDGVRLAPLPAARREVDAVTEIIGPQYTTRLMGALAGEAEVRRASTAADVLHFATHGIVSDDRPFESFLALASTGRAAATDGRLTTREVYDLQLKARLVVLSGCRTARGKVTGDGVLGLTRAFLYAGAPSLVATLWDVYDESGARLMPLFYREWQRPGDAATALRRAQIALIRDLRAGRVQVETRNGAFTLAEHPAVWAGFVLVGEP